MKHNILHPTFEFQFEGRKSDYQQLINTFREAIYEALPELEKILDKFSVPRYVIKIDSLDLDLGIIAENDLKREFKERLLNQFAEILQNITRGANTTKKILVEKEELADKSPNETEELYGEQYYGVSFVENEVAALEALNYFLETGKQAWWISTPNNLNQASITQLFQYITSTNPDLLKTLIEENYQNKVFRKRLFQQISLQNLLRLWFNNNESKIIFLLNVWQDLQKLNKFSLQMPLAYLKQQFGENIFEQFIQSNTQDNFDRKGITTQMLQIILKPLNINEDIFWNKIIEKSYAQEQDTVFVTIELQTTFIAKEQAQNYAWISNLIDNNPTQIADLQGFIKNRKFNAAQSLFFKESMRYLDLLSKNIDQTLAQTADKENLKRILLQQSLLYWKTHILTGLEQKKFVPYVVFRIFDKMQVEDIEKFFQNLEKINPKENLELQSIEVNKLKKGIEKEDKKSQFLEKIKDKKIFNESELIDILNEIIPEDVNWLLDFLRKIEIKANIFDSNTNQFKEILWDFITDFLYTNQYFSFDRQLFSSNIINNLAQKYKLTIEEVLKNIGIKELKITIDTPQKTLNITQDWQEIESISVFLATYSLKEIVYFLKEKYPKQIRNIQNFIKKITQNSTIDTKKGIINYTYKLVIELFWSNKNNEKTFTITEEIQKNLLLTLQKRYNLDDILQENLTNLEQNLLRIWQRGTETEKTLLQLVIEFSKEKSTTLNELGEPEIEKMLQIIAPLQIKLVKDLIQKSIDYLVEINPWYENSKDTIRQKLKFFLLKKLFNLKKRTINEPTLVNYVYDFLNQNYKIQLDNYKIITQENPFLYKYLQDKIQEKEYFFYLIDYFLETGEILWTEQLAHLSRNKAIFRDASKQKKIENILLFLYRDYKQELSSAIKEKEQQIKNNLKVQLFFQNIQNKHLKKYIESLKIQEVITPKEATETENIAFEKSEDTKDVVQEMLTLDEKIRNLEDKLSIYESPLEQLNPNQLIEIIEDFVVKKTTFYTQKYTLKEVLTFFEKEFFNVLLLYFSRLDEAKIAILRNENPETLTKLEQENEAFKDEIKQVFEQIKAKKYLPTKQNKLNEKEQKQALQKIQDALKKSKKRLKEWKGEPMYVQNAGLIILHPFLTRLFDMLGLLENNQFKDEIAVQKGIYLLEYLVRKSTNLEETALYLNKILCGVELQDVVLTDVEITEKEQEMCESLLQVVLNYWAVMSNSSTDALRGTFLMREGQITELPDMYILKVEQKTLDILLEQLTWSISFVKLPWMNKVLQVEWI